MTDAELNTIVSRAKHVVGLYHLMTMCDYAQNESDNLTEGRAIAAMLYDAFLDCVANLAGKSFKTPKIDYCRIRSYCGDNWSNSDEFIGETEVCDDATIGNDGISARFFLSAGTKAHTIFTGCETFCITARALEDIANSIYGHDEEEEALKALAAEWEENLGEFQKQGIW